MLPKEFRKLKIQERMELLTEHGDYFGARQKGSHTIHLYCIYKFYVEVWVYLPLNQVQWIEIQTNDQIINSYSQDVNLDDLFD